MVSLQALRNMEGLGMSAITERQKHILEHALGLSRSKRAYRNHFVTGHGSTDYADCCALEGAGLMSRLATSDLTGNMDCFYVTDLGKRVVMSKESP